MRKSFTFLFIISAIFIVLAACSNNNEGASEGDSNSEATGETEQSLFIGMISPPVSFNTIGNDDAASRYVQSFMFDSLLQMVEPLEFAPKLADEFETEDGQHYTIKLNEDATWTDGTPVTSDDVIFTLNLIANPDVATEVGAYVLSIEGVDENGKLPEGETEISSIEKISDKEFSFSTKQPVDPNMLKEQLGVQLRVMPKHVLEDIPVNELEKHEFMHNPTVTNGAYKFVTYEKDQHVQLEANEDYYRGAPNIPEIFIKIVPAPNLVAQLQTGEIHMNAIEGPGSIPVQEFELVESLDNVETEMLQTVGFKLMIFNTEKITEPKVRQAIAYSLDRQSIIENLLQGQGEIIDGPYTSINPYKNDDLENYTYDPEKAKQLLEEANWDFDRTLNLTVPTGDKIREESANIIAENLKAIGLKVEIEKFDFPTTMQRANDGEHELLLMGFNRTLDPDYTAIYGVNGTYNWMNYDNPEAQALLEEGKKEPDNEKRLDIYNDLQAIWHEDVPLISLYSNYEMSAVSKYLINVEPKPFGMLYDVQNWDFK